MTHWEVAQACFAGVFLATCAVAGWIAGGIVYLGA
jgi:hypothetical protein